MIQTRRLPFVIAKVILLLLSFFYMIYGLIDTDIGLLSAAAFLWWSVALADAFTRRNRNIIYIFFLFTFFLFLLSRTIVIWINNGEIYMPFCYQTMVHIYCLIIVTLAGLLVGNYVNFQFGRRNKNTQEQYLLNKDKMDVLRNVSAPLTIIAGIAQLLVVLERAVFYQVGFGGAMRVSFSSGLPSLLLSISYEYTLLFCIYLATMPKKREALGFIGQYLFIAAIKMVYGSRCDFILGLMFVLVYFVIRDRINEKYNLAETQWFGKMEKTITLVSIPVLIILLTFIGTYRVGSNFQFTTFTDVLVNFFESQGITINVLGYAYENAEKLTQPHFLYLFDDTYTFLTANPISRLFTDRHIYMVNTVERAIYGTSLDQSLYYIINRVSYLNGNGCGSSYIAETYLAFGYLGTFLFNIILANVLNKIDVYGYSKFWKNVLVLIFILSLFFIPRSGFDDFVGEFASATHILVIMFVWLIYKDRLGKRERERRSML